MHSLNDFQSETIYKKIGANVANVRKSRGISQMELAYSMGFSSVGFISAAEIGKSQKHFSIEHLMKISIILDIPLCELLDGVDLCKNFNQ